MDFYSNSSGTMVVMFDRTDSAFLSIQIAANIIWQCEHCSFLGVPANAASSTDPDFPGDQPELTPTAIRQSLFGSTQHLEVQAELLYGIITEIVSRPNDFWSSSFACEARTVVLLVTAALASYQEFKTALWQRRQEVHGKGMGNGMFSYQRDWTDKNEALEVILASACAAEPADPC